MEEEDLSQGMQAALRSWKREGGDSPLTPPGGCVPLDLALETCCRLDLQKYKTIN